MKDKTADIDNLIKKAIENLQFDRTLAEIFVEEISQFIKDAQNPDEKEGRLRVLGNVATKFIEAMQRSNEQLLKLASLQQRRGNDANYSDEALEELERDIFDEIAKERENAKE